MFIFVHCDIFVIGSIKKLLLNFKKFLYLQKIVPAVFAFIELVITGKSKFPTDNFRLLGFTLIPELS